MNLLRAYVGVFRRNKLLILVSSAALGSGVLISALVVLASFSSFPSLMRSLRSLIDSRSGPFNMPSLDSTELFRFILTNNTAHFWNPAHFAVWIPLIGAFLFGVELLLNAVVIGGSAAFFSLLRGPVFTFVGLAPHGVIEIPAFLLESAAFARWQMLTLRWLGAKMAGKPTRGLMVGRDLKDVAIMASTALGLFVVAAYVEAYFTLSLLQAYPSSQR